MNWVGFMGLDQRKPLLQVREDMDILAVVPFGYPVQPAGRGKKNHRPLGEVAYREQFGQPFE